MRVEVMVYANNKKRSYHSLSHVKITFIIMIMSLLLLVGFPSTAQASSCGTLPSAISGLITSCIPVNIVNTQSAATPSGFQQMLSSFPINALAGNFVVYNSLSGATMPAWVESNSIVWVNLEGNTIAASSSANEIYYIGIGGSSTNFFISGNNIGEAPQLSSTYAQYDNGATVFPTLYQNFAGTSVPTGWTTIGTAPTINNGVSISVAAGGESFVITTATYSYPNILESYVNSWTSGRVSLEQSTLNTESTGYINSGYQSLYVDSGTPFYALFSVASGGATAQVSTSYSTSFKTGIQGTAWTATGSEYEYLNYAQIGSATDTSVSISNQYASLGTGASGTTNTWHFYWIRLRTYPPNGVMPATTFNTIQTNSDSGGGSATLSISTNPATYGQGVTVTATCATGDSCAVDYPSVGTSVASGTTTATYTISPFAWAAGTYSSFYADDITAGVNSVGQSLTINKNDTYSFTLTYRGAAVVNGQAFSNNLNASGYLVGNVATHNNQLSAKLEYNVASPAVCSSTTGCSYNSVWNDKNNWANWTAVEYICSLILFQQRNTVSILVCLWPLCDTLTIRVHHYPIRF